MIEVHNSWFGVMSYCELVEDTNDQQITEPYKP